MVIGCICAVIYRGYGYLFKLLPLKVIFIKTQMLEYLYLSFPGLFQNAFEWILIDIATILAGYIAFSHKAISVTVIMNNIMTIFISFALGISYSINIRVGGYIGRRQILPAKQSAMIGVCLYSFASTVIAIVLGIFARDIPHMWTTDTDIIDISARVILYVMIVLDFGILGLLTITGIYRALGKQKKSAIFVVISYWMFSFPLALVLLFAMDLRSDVLYGSVVIWGSLTAGNVLGFVSVVIYLCVCVDWKQAVFEAVKRVEGGHKIMKSYEQTVASYQAN